MFKARIFVAIVAIGALTLGCQEKGNPNAPAKVLGKVTYKGELVTIGTLTFYGADGSINSCSINPDGTYIGTDFPIGEMTITIDNEFANPDRKKIDYKGGTGGMGGKMASMYGKKAAAGPVSGTHKEVAKSSPVPEYANAQTGTYVKLPAKYAKKETSDAKLTLVKGENKKDIELTD